MIPENTQGPWAEDILDRNFLGSGKELDLLSEILDSLSVEAKANGRLRNSQSLDCCQGGLVSPFRDKCLPSLSPTLLPHLRSATCLSLHPTLA